VGYQVPSYLIAQNAPVELFYFPTHRFENKQSQTRLNEAHPNIHMTPHGGVRHEQRMLSLGI